jgi:hypothetical protein
MRLRAPLAGLGAALLVAGCSPGASAGPQKVFAVASGFYQGGPGVTSEILDIGLPALENVSLHTVRLTGIRLVGTSKAVRLRNVTAFRYGVGLGLSTGDMHACKGANRLTTVVTSPRARSAWYVVIAVTFAKPGRYRIDRVRISYVTDGHSGWQYQNVFTRMVIHAHWPLGNPKPVFANPCP